MPVAAYAEISGSEIRLRALLASADGRQILRAEAMGLEPATTAHQVVASLKAMGADDILRSLR